MKSYKFSKIMNDDFHVRNLCYVTPTIIYILAGRLQGHRLINHSVVGYKHTFIIPVGLCKESRNIKFFAGLPIKLLTSESLSRKSFNLEQAFLFVSCNHNLLAYALFINCTRYPG